MMAINQAPLTILAIDDELDVLREIAAALSAAGYACHCAQDAQTAGDFVQQSTPDLILVDLHLAGQSGLSLADQIKAEAGLGEVPLLFLSASQGPDIIRRAHPSGGTHYHLRKPFDAEILLRLVEAALLSPHLSHA